MRFIVKSKNKLTFQREEVHPTAAGEVCNLAPQCQDNCRLYYNIRPPLARFVTSLRSVKIIVDFTIIKYFSLRQTLATLGHNLTGYATKEHYRGQFIVDSKNKFTLVA